MDNNIKQYNLILQKSRLFEGCYSDLDKILNCVDAKIKKYAKNDNIIVSGEKVNSVYIMLKGSAKIIKDDINGNENIISELGKGDIFGEVFVCSGKESFINVRTTDDCGVMLINYKRIIFTCASSCSAHTKLIENMIKLLAEKNIILNNKIDIISKKTIREKILTFFAMQNSDKVKIPFNREEFADFLCTDRSALSRELSKMQNEGLLRYNKNVFEILQR